MDYIPDWTEQAGPYDKREVRQEYTDLDELRDEEERRDRY